MQVCGRESERTLLEQWLGRPTAWPAAVALEGVAGIGKSTLWREAVGLAREHGLHVIATAPAEPDRALAFAALGDLFSELRADLPTPQQQALSAALFEEDGVPGSGPQPLPRAVLGVLRGLAAGDPPLVAIGDEPCVRRRGPGRPRPWSRSTPPRSSGARGTPPGTGRHYGLLILEKRGTSRDSTWHS